MRHRTRTEFTEGSMRHFSFSSRAMCSGWRITAPVSLNSLGHRPTRSYLRSSILEVFHGFHWLLMDVKWF